MESSMFKPSSMDLIRAGLQDLDKARALFDQLKADDIPDERCAELLSALAHACDPDMALSNFVDIVNRYERHFHINLRMFGLAVGAEVFVAEAPGQLEVAVNAAGH